MSQEQAVAVITGSSKGIGKRIAERFAESGYRVVVSGRNEERTNALAEALNSAGHAASAVVGDVSISEDANQLIGHAVDRYGRIDVLVNNAGITRDGLMMRMKDEDWDSVINVNLKGTFNCIRAANRPMMKQRSGRIINITSVVGVIGNPGQANYVAAKSGVIGLTKTVAKELASRGVTCNAIAPGFIETDMTDHLQDDLKQKMLEQIPLNRMGSADDVAKVAEFLASDASAYITGQVIHVDGGMVM